MVMYYKAQLMYKIVHLLIIMLHECLLNIYNSKLPPVTRVVIHLNGAVLLVGPQRLILYIVYTFCQAHCSATLRHT